MSDSTDSGWWAAGSDPPTPAATEQLDLALRPRRRAPRSLLFLPVLVAAVLLVAVQGGAFAGAGPAALAPGTHSPSQAWTSAQGLQVHSAYLTSCQSAGGGAGYCGCLFSQITAQAPYSTPATFAALGAAVKQDEQSNDTAAIPTAVTQADNTCSQPGATTPSAKHPI